MAGFTVTTEARTECRIRLEGCGRLMSVQLMPHFHSRQQFLSFVQTMSISSVCSTLEGFNECVEEVLTTVCASEDVDEEVHIFTGLISYACSPTGQQLLETMRQSSCFGDMSSYRTLERHIDMCGKQMHQRMGPYLREYDMTGETPEHDVFCPLLAEAQECFVGGTANLCGEAFGQFLNPVWETYVSYIFRRVGCYETLRRASTFAKRTLEHFLGQ